MANQLGKRFGLVMRRRRVLERPCCSVSRSPQTSRSAGRTHGQQVRGAFTTPEHTRLLEALSNHCLAASLHHARADEIAGLSKRLIEHLGVVAFKVSNLLLGRFTGLD